MARYGSEAGVVFYLRCGDDLSAEKRSFYYQDIPAGTVSVEPRSHSGDTSAYDYDIMDFFQNITSEKRTKLP